MTTTRRLAALPLAAGLALLGACGAEGSTATTTTVAAATTAAGPVASTATSPATPTSAAATTATTDPAAATTSPAPTTTAVDTPTAPAVAAGSRLPVYLVGPDGDGRTESGATAPRLRLFREFRPTPAGAASGSAQDVAATRAVSLAMEGGSGYLSPWGESSVVSTRRAGGTISVTLSAPGPASVDAQTARLAVASLVWTATAAYGADEPVRFVVPGGRVIGSVTTASPQRRAAGAEQAEVLAGIWIDTPAVDQRMATGRVTAKGQASVHEASVRWRVAQGTRTVREGVATAAVAAPSRGAWSADLGTLPAGDYTLTACSDSAADAGGRLAQVTHAFRVG